jgi:hypothetical protein
MLNNNTNKLFLLIGSIIFCQSILAQDYIISYSLKAHCRFLRDIHAAIDFRDRDYSIWDESGTNMTGSMSMMFYRFSISSGGPSGTFLSKGKITVANDLVTCSDTLDQWLLKNMPDSCSCIDIFFNPSKEIVFKIIDEYRIVVKETNCCLLKNDTLFATHIRDKNNNHTWMEWKDGKRHGEWRETSQNGVTLTEYDNGKKITTWFKTYKEIEEERLKEEKEEEMRIEEEIRKLDVPVKRLHPVPD